MSDQYWHRNEVNSGKCGLCKHWDYKYVVSCEKLINDPPDGDCKRFPYIKPTNAMYGCGEFSINPTINVFALMKDNEQLERGLKYLDSENKKLKEKLKKHNQKLKATKQTTL